MKFYPILAVVRNPNSGEYDRFKSAHTQLTVMVDGVPTAVRVIDTHNTESITTGGVVNLKGAKLTYLRHPKDPVQTAICYVISGRPKKMTLTKLAKS